MWRRIRDFWRARQSDRVIDTLIVPPRPLFTRFDQALRDRTTAKRYAPRDDHRRRVVSIK